MPYVRSLPLTTSGDNGCGSANFSVRVRGLLQSIVAPDCGCDRHRRGKNKPIGYVFVYVTPLKLNLALWLAAKAVPKLWETYSDQKTGITPPNNCAILKGSMT